MTVLILGFVSFIIGGVLIWRFRSPIVYALTMAAVLATFVHTAGMPRPRAVGIPETITVVAVIYAVDEAIYLWAEGDPPVAYALPWSEPLAEQLQDEMLVADETGAMGIEINLGAAYGGDRDIMSDEHQRAPRKDDE